MVTIRQKLHDRLSFGSTNLVSYNFFHLLLESTIFWTAMSLLDPNTVIAVFLDTFAGNPAFSGLAATLKTATYAVGQVMMSMFIHRLPSQRRFMARIGFVGRPMILLSALLMLMGLDGAAAAWAFLICYSLFYFFDGFIALNWTEMMARTTPVMLRGRVQSYNYVFGGIMGILGGQLVGVIMASSLDERMRYIVIFGIAGVILVLNAVALAMIRDVPIVASPRPRYRLTEYFHEFGPMIRQSKAFREVTVSRTLYLCGLLAAPVNILFGRSAGGLTDADVATLLTMQVIGQMVGGFFWGKLSMYKGYRAVMLWTQGINVALNAVSVICLGLAAGGVNLLLPMIFVMFFTQFSTVGWAGYANYMMAGVPDEKRALYNALTCVATLPANFGTLLVGLVSGSAGYVPVYVFMLGCSAVGLAHCIWRFGGKRGIVGDNI